MTREVTPPVRAWPLYRKVLVGVAGLTFLLKAGGGLYWLIPAAVTSLLGGVVNAWLFLVRGPAGPRQELPRDIPSSGPTQ
jgi:hypothetical protein